MAPVRYTRSETLAKLSSAGDSFFVDIDAPCDATSPEGMTGVYEINTLGDLFDACAPFTGRVQEDPKINGLKSATFSIHANQAGLAVNWFWNVHGGIGSPVVQVYMWVWGSRSAVALAYALRDRHRGAHANEESRALPIADYVSSVHGGPGAPDPPVPVMAGGAAVAAAAAAAAPAPEHRGVKRRATEAPDGGDEPAPLVAPDAADLRAEIRAAREAVDRARKQAIIDEVAASAVIGEDVTRFRVLTDPQDVFDVFGDNSDYEVRITTADGTVDMTQKEWEIYVGGKPAKRIYHKAITVRVKAQGVEDE